MKLRILGCSGGIGGDAQTTGGRVLCVTALGDTVAAAQQAAYQCAQGISWQGAFYRTDIGLRAIARERQEPPV